MNVRELREALEDVPDEAFVLHAAIRHEGDTIILTDGCDEEEEDDDITGGGITWPEEET